MDRVSISQNQESERDKKLARYSDAINGIDCMCQTQLGQIDAIIMSTLRAMETPDFWRHPLAMRESLGLIQYLAGDLMNFVNATAEIEGCNFVDEVGRAREMRILQAARAIQETGANHV
ncbi:hypothetical protein LMG22037_04672 [Paraburkholderia phenoliruptrix]|uniref:Uncharacterized protein n=1 Tax=Paraburkholderia phenoliruptrix TaxID=252970 RepID=A0A6J5BY00_9BURK|nr:hypothetical protein [Paraburkholderia phenoliruptrix]CAB3719897.1 hypothetical protein LMG22037_04672 [Paraburkholderia phenoliruptrix]